MAFRCGPPTVIGIVAAVLAGSGAAAQAPDRQGIDPFVVALDEALDATRRCAANECIGHLMRSASAAVRTGDLQLAEKQARAAVRLTERQLDPNDAVQADALELLADVLERRANFVAAEPHWRRALAIRNETDRQIAVARTLEQAARFRTRIRLSENLKSQGRYREAEEDLVFVKSRTMGISEHPDRQIILARSMVIAKFDDSIPFDGSADRSALEFQIPKLDPERFSDRRYYADRLVVLGRLLLDAEMAAQAEAVLRLALEMRSQDLSKGDPLIAESRSELAAALARLARFEEAGNLHREALAAIESGLTDTNPMLSRALLLYGDFLEDTASFEQAIDVQRRVLAIRRSQLQEGHPGIAEPMARLARLYDAMGERESARPLHLRALEIRQSALDERHRAVELGLRHLIKHYIGADQLETAFELRSEWARAALGQNSHVFFQYEMLDAELRILRYAKGARERGISPRTMLETRTKYPSNLFPEGHPAYATPHMLLGDWLMLVNAHGRAGDHFHSAQQILIAAYDSQAHPDRITVAWKQANRVAVSLARLSQSSGRAVPSWFETTLREGLSQFRTAERGVLQSLGQRTDFSKAAQDELAGYRPLFIQKVAYLKALSEVAEQSR